MVRLEKISSGYAASVELRDENYDVLIMGYGESEKEAVVDLQEHLGDIQLYLSRFTGGLPNENSSVTSH